jgi:NADPH:quinone reductase-like Zn-dependent oxidoreductase
MAGRPYLIRLLGFGFRRPKAANPGRALAGTVAAVGDGVSGFAPGDEVYGTADGAYAEYVLVPPDQLARKPGRLSFEEAAALPISASTALQAVRDEADVQPGESVLVIGAGGGVGGFAVQIAKAFGAEVTGVARAGHLERVRALGADHVIDHERHEITDDGRQWDVIVDTGGHRRLSVLRRALRPKGRLVIVGSETGGRWTGGFGRSLRAPLVSRFVDQDLRMLSSTENADDLDALRGLVDAGRLSPIVDRAFPLADSGAAIRHLESGQARGKVVIAV